MKEYKLAKGWQVFMWIMCPLMIALGTILLLEPAISKANDFTWSLYAFMGPLALGIIIIFALGIRELLVYKITVAEDTITVRSAFGTRQLRFDEIEGFTVDKQVIISPNRDDKKKITISSYIGNYDELRSWLGEHFTDLNKRALEDDQKEIMGDDTFGFSEEERKQNLAGAALKARIVNIAGLIVGAWVWFYPRPYGVAIITCGCLLFVAMVVARTSGGLIHLGKKKNGAYPSVAIALFSSALIILVRGLSDFELYAYRELWLPLAIAAVVVFLLLFPDQRERQYRKTVVGDMMFVAAAYAFGAVVFYNCYFDNSRSIEYNVAVNSKRVRSGKSTSYYLGVTKWGDHTDGDEVRVSRRLYNSTRAGDSIDIYLSKGTLGIPWISIWGR